MKEIFIDKSKEMPKEASIFLVFYSMYLYFFGIIFLETSYRQIAFLQISMSVKRFLDLLYSRDVYVHRQTHFHFAPDNLKDHINTRKVGDLFLKKYVRQSHVAV